MFQLLLLITFCSWFIFRSIPYDGDVNVSSLCPKSLLAPSARLFAQPRWQFAKRSDCPTGGWCIVGDSDLFAPNWFHPNQVGLGWDQVYKFRWFIMFIGWGWWMKHMTQYRHGVWRFQPKFNFSHTELVLKHKFHTRVS